MNSSSKQILRCFRFPLILFIIVVNYILKGQRIVLIQVIIHTLVHVLILVSGTIIFDSTVNFTVFVHLNRVVCENESILNCNSCVSVHSHIFRVNIDIPIIRCTLSFISNFALDVDCINMIFNL